MKRQAPPHAHNIRNGLALGESLDAVTAGFGLAVIAVVFIGRKMPVCTTP